MQKCPVCGSENSDQDGNCGVCGASLRPTFQGAVSSGQSYNVVESDTRRGTNRKAWFALTIGPLLCIIGVVLFLNLLNLGSETLAWYGFGILVAGLITIMSSLGTGLLFRGRYAYRAENPRFRRFAGANRTEPRPHDVEVQEGEVRDAEEEEYEDDQTAEERKEEKFD